MDETLVPRQTGDTLGAPAVEALAGQAAEAERLGRLPDATVALLSGGGEVNTVFSVPPFQHQQLVW